MLYKVGLQRTDGWAIGPVSGTGSSAGELQGSCWRRTGPVPEAKYVKTLAHIPPSTVQVTKSHHISKTPPQLPKAHILLISEHHQRETPLLTKQYGTSIDGLARFPSGDGVDRATQTLRSLCVSCFRYRCQRTCFRFRLYLSYFQLRFLILT